MRSGCLLFLVLLLLPVFFVSPLAVEARSATLEPVADTYVDENNPVTNYGGESYLALEDDIGGDEFLIFIKFDLSDLPSDAEISSVKLRLNTMWVSATKNIGAHRVTDTTWEELNITYNNKPSHAAAVTDAVNVGYEDIWYEWDVTTDVTSLDDYSWALKIETLVQDWEWVWFYSKEIGFFGEEPELEVSYSSQEEDITTIIVALLIILVIVGIAVYYTKHKKKKELPVREGGLVEEVGKETVKKIVYCPYCGTQNAAGSKFCVKCGTDILST